MRPTATRATPGDRGVVSAPGGDALPALVLLGSACVVVGGLVAAATGPLRLGNGSWMAAYLVLVCGVGSYAIGRMQSRPAVSPLPSAWRRAQLACWCVGNAAVITGAMAVRAWVVDAGVPLLVVALVIAVVDEMRGDHPAGRWLSLAYRALLVVLIVSTPVGAVLAHLQKGT